MHELLAVIFVVSLVAHLFWVVWLHRGVSPHPSPSTIRRHDNLDPFALAYLSGDVRRAVYATLVMLVGHGLVRARGGRLERPPGAGVTATDTCYRGDPRSNESRLTGRVLGALSVGPRTVAQLVRVARADEDALRSDLIDRGLLSPRMDTWAHIAAVVPALVVSTLGIARVVRGISLGPVLFLVILLIVHVSVAVLALRRPLGVTQLGRAVLARARGRLASLGLTVQAAPSQLSPLEQGLACSVFGDSVLTASHPELLAVLGVRPASSDGATASCGASCGGGCGAGCGGCGA